MPHSAPPPAGLRVFISYSRRDTAVADRLVSALEEAGFVVAIDRRDLPYGEEWQQELAHFIRASDTVVWLVSSASLASRWCHWELGEVQRTSKRLLPVAIESAAPESLPEELGRVHVLPASGAFDFASHLTALVEALNTDSAWLKEHTRLADRARQWQSRERASSLLLRGVALKDAQAWADRKPSAAPAPSDEILQLLLASRHAQSRRQRMSVAASLAAAVIGIGLAGTATWQWSTAEKQRALAEQRAISEQAAREEAERNFETARATVDSVVADVVGGLRGVEGLRADSLRAVLTQVETTVDELTARAPGNADVERTRAMMLRQFGDAYASVGDITEADAAYARAMEILAPFLAAQPDERVLMQELTLAAIGHGRTRGMLGDSDGAIAAHGRALALAEDLAADDSDGVDSRLLLAKAHLALAKTLHEASDRAAAMDQAMASASIVGELSRSMRDGEEFQSHIADTHALLGDILLSAGMRAEALPRYEAALAIRTRLADSAKGDLIALRKLAMAEVAVGTATEYSFAAMNRISKASHTLSVLFYDDPYNLALIPDLIAAHTAYAHATRDLDPLEALHRLKSALSNAEEWARASDPNIIALRAVADAHARLAEWSERQKVDDEELVEEHHDAALQDRREALAVRERIAALPSAAPVDRHKLAVARYRLGDLLMEADDSGEAAEHFRSAAETMDRLVADWPGNPAWRLTLVEALLRESSIADEPARAAGLERAAGVLDTLEAEDHAPEARTHLRGLVEARLADMEPVP